MPDLHPLVLTEEQVGDLLQVDPDRVRSLSTRRNDRLPSVKVGVGARRYLLADVQGWLQEQRES
ncbi:MAG: hypothetical protein V7607_1217 [Solirubrobacteraceae bacterium]